LVEQAKKQVRQAQKWPCVSPKCFVDLQACRLQKDISQAKSRQVNAILRVLGVGAVLELSFVARFAMSTCMLGFL